MWNTICSAIRMPRLRVLLLAFSFASSLAAQESADRVIQSPSPLPVERDKRLFGIIPNNRTFPTLTNYKPLTTHEKFKMASDDALDRGTFLLAAGFAGEGQLTNANPSFGQGVKGYAHYLVTSYADWAIGDYMTEALLPSMLHQDPRYFRKGCGSGMSRLLYAVGQIFWTHTDSGGHSFNFSEIGGNAAAVAVSQAYYPENRSAASAAGKLATQIGVDMASNVVKEFYPEIRHLLRKRGTRSADNSLAGR